MCVFGAVCTNCEAFVERGCVCVGKHYIGRITGKQAKSRVLID